MIIRTIRPGDAEQFLRLCLQLDEETQFMLFEPGERNTSVEQQRMHIYVDEYYMAKLLE